MKRAQCVEPGLDVILLQLAAADGAQDDPGRDVVPQRLGGGRARPVRQGAHRARAGGTVHDDVAPAGEVLGSAATGGLGVAAPAVSTIALSICCCVLSSSLRTSLTGSKLASSTSGICLIQTAILSTALATP